MQKKTLDFEVNLLPMISVLSIAICFLLVSAIWVRTGTINVDQAFGQEAGPDNAANPPSVWVMVAAKGDVELRLKDVSLASSRLKENVVPGIKDGINWKAVEASIARLHETLPDVKTALVLPSERVRYGDVIRIMDQFKKYQIANIGIAPN